MESPESAPVDVVDIHDEAQIERLFGILDAYARGPGGQNAPLGPEAREQFGPFLRAHLMSFVLFGRLGGERLDPRHVQWSPRPEPARFLGPTGGPGARGGVGAARGNAATSEGPRRLEADARGGGDERGGAAPLRTLRIRP